MPCRVTSVLSKAMQCTPIDIDGRMRQVIGKWLEEDEEASWEKLCRVLRDMKLSDTADKIQTEYGLT